jgi:hypothetical protein
LASNKKYVRRGASQNRKRFEIGNAHPLRKAAKDGSPSRASAVGKRNYWNANTVNARGRTLAVQIHLSFPFLDINAPTNGVIRGRSLFLAHGARCIIFGRKWRTQMRFELFGNGRIVRSGGKCKVTLAVLAFQETARNRHEDRNTVGGNRKTVG